MNDNDVDCFLYRNCPLIGYFASLHSQNPSMSLAKCLPDISHLYRNCPLIGYFASLHSQNPSMSLAKLQVFASHVRSQRRVFDVNRLCEGRSRNGATWQSMNDAVDCHVATRKDEDGVRRLCEHLRRLRE